MKKLVIKTTVIALSIIIALTILGFTIVATTSPLIIANACFRVGNKDLAVTYTEKHYLKTLEFEDLALLVERGISANNDEIVTKYTPQLIYSENFESFASAQSGDYTNFIANGYVSCLYSKGEIDKAIVVAFQYVDANFTLPNPVTTLVYTASGKNDVNTLTKILAELEILKENENIIKVINAIKSFI